MGPHSTRERAGDRLAVAPSMDPALDSVNAPARARRGGLARRLGECARGRARARRSRHRPRSDGAHRSGHEPLLLRPALDRDRGPADNHLGWLVVIVPVVGGLVVGAMARYGSAAIRGHGIPEAMEQVLFNESRIPVRMTFLKPLSAAISIGTGRTVRRRGANHRDRRRARLLPRAGAARLGAGAQDAPGRRSGGGHGGDLRQPGQRRAAGDRAAAVRVPTALDGARGARERRGLRRAHGPRGLAPAFTMPHRRRAERLRARRVHRHGRRRRPRVDAGDTPGLRHRGRVREAAAALDVVAGHRRRRRGGGRLLVAAHDGGRLRQHRSHPVGRSRGAGGGHVLRAQARLVVGVARQRARRAVRWRRSSPSAAGWARRSERWRLGAAARRAWTSASRRSSAWRRSSRGLRARCWLRSSSRSRRRASPWASCRCSAVARRRTSCRP